MDSEADASFMIQQDSQLPLFDIKYVDNESSDDENQNKKVIFSMNEHQKHKESRSIGEAEPKTLITASPSSPTSVLHTRRTLSEQDAYIGGGATNASTSTSDSIDNDNQSCFKILNGCYPFETPRFGSLPLQQSNDIAVDDHNSNNNEKNRVQNSMKDLEALRKQLVGHGILKG